MPKRIDEILLTDIINNIEIVIEFTNGFTFPSFNADIKTQYAADRCFEIIGEAARSLSDDFINNNAGIEWHKLIAFRNVLIHEYFRVDRNIQWNIITNTLPNLLSKLKEI
jgi:uncharacterized protein with HEPN domain